MNIRLAAQPTIDSIVDGLGLRTVFWFQGCLHHCKNCHNPSTWDMNNGFITTTDELVNFYLNQDLQSGVTISGGDPFYQPDVLLDLLKKLKNYDVNIWVYTGFKYEDINKEFLKYIDVLVDDVYIDELRTLNLPFRGSSNQRVIDVKNSKDKIVEVKFNE